MAEFNPGDMIRGYEVVSRISAGGMATLYLARRRGAAGFSKLVAIKAIHSHLSRDEKFIRMFLDEARLASLIQHPNVVSVEELIEDKGTYLMVMEYVYGASYFDLIRQLAGTQRSLSAEIATHIVAQVADGLHAAHELRDPSGKALDVIHRDVSPQNILISYAGHPKLIDFGVAKSKAQSEATRAGVIRGKLGYMSPEQASGQHLDRRTDVYALGVVLWESLTSRRLFKAPNEAALYDKVRNPRIVPPGEFCKVPRALERVVMDALQIDRNKRISTAKELRDRLLKALPAANSVHSSDVAGLLETVLGDQIGETELSMSDLLLDRQEASESFVHRHTTAAPKALFETSNSTADLDIASVFEEPPPPSVGLAGVPFTTGSPSIPPPPPVPRTSSGIQAGTAFSNFFRVLLGGAGILIALFALALTAVLVWQELLPPDLKARLLGEEFNGVEEAQPEGSGQNSDGTPLMDAGVDADGG